MLDLEQLRRELDDARQEVRNLIVMSLAPNLSAERAALIRDLERSARAEVKLRTMALKHAKAQSRANGTH